MLTKKELEKKTKADLIDNIRSLQGMLKDYGEIKSVLADEWANTKGLEDYVNTLEADLRVKQESIYKYEEEVKSLKGDFDKLRSDWRTACRKLEQAEEDKRAFRVLALAVIDDDYD